jgi:hypothetical protein
MSSIDDLDADTLEPTDAGWQPRPWWAWCATLMIAGALLLGWAGARLSASELGTSLRARGCDGGVLGALALLALGALCVLLGMSLARLQHPGAQLAWDPSTLTWTLPIPVLVLGATIPGVAGCRAASDIADIALVGDALVGASGIMLAGAAAALVAAAFAATASVSWLAPRQSLLHEPASIVERAMQDAEAFESEGAAERFRGVDPVD